MACPLLDKLAPELREKIYGYVLHFDDVPLRHATQLQPFVKKLTGVDGELPFAYEDSAKRAPELEWIACDGLFGGIPKIDTAILSTCKTIYNEAIKTFYDQNTISVDIELFKLANITSPAGSDLSLDKNLNLTFNSSCNEREQNSHEFNAIDFDNLFARTGATFPALQSIVVHTDGCTLPSTSLFNIAQRCLYSPYFTSIGFENVGSVYARPRHGRFTVTVKYKELTELWREFYDMSSGRMPSAFSSSYDQTLDGQVGGVVFGRKIIEAMGCTDFTLLFLASAEKDVRTLAEFCPTFRTAGINDHLFWTNVACPYVPYRDSLPDE